MKIYIPALKKDWDGRGVQFELDDYPWRLRDLPITEEILRDEKFFESLVSHHIRRELNYFPYIGVG